MRGLGVETAKNLILAGPAVVDLHDPTIVQWGDLSSNFYLKESDVGAKSRAQASEAKLKELNGYVKVNVIPSIEPEILKNYNVVCFTEVFDTIDTLIQANKFCHENNIGFIASQNVGAAGYVFLDYGEKFQVLDADGEDTKEFIVSDIT